MKDKKVLTPTEIIDRMIAGVGVENDNQLADYLGVERQQIRQYRKGKGDNLPCKIISELLQREPPPAK